MDRRGTSVCLFLLLLSSCHADAGRSTTQTITTITEDQSGSSAHQTESLPAADHTLPPDADTNGTRADCLIDTEMGLIAIGSAGGLIVCLLIATMVLACQVCHIQRRVYAPPRTSRSNMDLVSSASYWGSDQPGVGGMLGPCDASVVLEEVRAEGEWEEERQSEIQEVGEEGGARLEEGAAVMSFDVEENVGQIQGSSSRDSCLEVPRDLEDMPLVV